MSNTDYIGRKIYGFEFDGVEYRTCGWDSDMERYIGKVGTILCFTEYENVEVLFSDGNSWAYPLPLIEQHLVPESGGENVIPKPMFDFELGLWGIEMEEFSIFSKDESICLSRAQVFVNAEAYRVENERLKADYDHAVKVIQELLPGFEFSYKKSVAACAHEEFLREDRDVMRKAREIISKHKSALSQNT